MLCCVSWQIVTDITQDSSVSMFKVKQSSWSEKNSLDSEDEDAVML